MIKVMKFSDRYFGFKKLRPMCELMDMDVDVQNLSTTLVRIQPGKHTHKIWENCTKRAEGSRAGDGERTNVHNQVCNKRHCSLSFLFFITHQ